MAATVIIPTLSTKPTEAQFFYSIYLLVIKSMAISNSKASVTVAALLLLLIGGIGAAGLQFSGKSLGFAGITGASTFVSSPTTVTWNSGNTYDLDTKTLNPSSGADISLLIQSTANPPRHLISPQNNAAFALATANTDCKAVTGYSTTGPVITKSIATPTAPAAWPSDYYFCVKTLAAQGIYTFLINYRATDTDATFDFVKHSAFANLNNGDSYDLDSKTINPQSGADLSADLTNSKVNTQNGAKIAQRVESTTSCYSLYTISPVRYSSQISLPASRGYGQCVRTGDTPAAFYTIQIWKSSATTASLDDGTGFGLTCADADGDKYGSKNTNLNVCTGSTTVADCNDGNNKIYPGASEICDGADNDCDDQTDEGCFVAASGSGTLEPGNSYDFDGDGVNDLKIIQATYDPTYNSYTIGFGALNNAKVTNAANLKADTNCYTASGYGSGGSYGAFANVVRYNCLKTSSSKYYLLAFTTANPISATWTEQCTDSDGDTYGAADTDLSACTGSTTVADCRDNNADINPGANEICDGEDNNCNEETDEGGVCNTAQNCGTYGNACPTDVNGVASCSNGQCSLSCNTGYELQNGACVYVCSGTTALQISPTSGLAGSQITATVSGLSDCDETDAKISTSADCSNAASLCDISSGQCSGTITIPADATGTVTYHACVDKDASGSYSGTEISVGQEFTVQACNDGDTQACYTASQDTKDVGECKGGTQTCADGAWGACAGEVTPAASEACDGADDNCNGQTDENNVCNDISNCGTFGNACSFANALAECSESLCILSECNSGFWNIDGDSANGCEYQCTITNNGVEIVDSLDNDCDGAFLPEEADADQDGVPIYLGDCDDDDAAAYLGNANLVCIDGSETDANCNDQPDYLEEACGYCATGNIFNEMTKKCELACGNRQLDTGEQCDDGNTNEGDGCSATCQTEISACNEQWSCADWSACSSEGSQTRTCTDANNCGTVEQKPAEQQACVYAPSCTPKWSCTEWVACTDNSQIRTCTDSNNCGTTSEKPAEEQACMLEGAGLGEGTPLAPSAPSGGGGGGGGGGGSTYYGSGGHNTTLASIFSAPVLGNGVCEKGESAANACVDCSCAVGYQCVANKCTQLKEVAQLKAQGKDVSAEPKEVISANPLKAKAFGLKLPLPVTAGLIAAAIIVTLTAIYELKKRGGRREEAGGIEEGAAVEGPQQPEAHKPADLNSYIRSARQQGASLSEIRKQLLDAGWQADAIDEAFGKL